MLLPFRVQSLDERLYSCKRVGLSFEVCGLKDLYEQSEVEIQVALEDSDLNF